MLERGADPLVRDHYCHSAWDYALERFLDAPDPGAYPHHLDALYPLLSPPVIDVQTGNRLVRLERHQGEYWLFSLMLVSYKKLLAAALRRCRPSCLLGCQRMKGGVQLHLLHGLGKGIQNEGMRCFAHLFGSGTACVFSGTYLSRISENTHHILSRIV